LVSADRSCGVRMNLAMGRVDHQPFIIGLIYKQFKQSFPFTFVAPAAKSAMCILPIAVIRGQVAPRRTCTQYPKNSVDKLSIVARISAPSALTPF
jgi:hypothetical protein